MRECLIVGRPNSGKTMFALNFANFLGCRSVDITFKTYDGLLTCRHLNIDEAKRELCSSTIHKTKSLQTMVLKLSVGKATVGFKLSDTCGIAEYIHTDDSIRRGMAQTLSVIRSADFIIHVIDLTCLGKDVPNQDNIDIDIYNYGIARANYVLLANKIDVASKYNIAKVKDIFPQAPVIAISALCSQGFKEVKACVARNI